MYHIKDLEQHLRLVRVRNFDYIATSIISQYVTNAHLLPRLQGRVSQCGRRDNHWSLRNTFCKLNLENVGFDRNGWWRTGPQPEGGQSGNCPRRNFHKRMYLLATATSYIILPPPENISWLRPWWRTSSWATNVIRSLSSLRVSNNCDRDFFTLCTICKLRNFEAAMLSCNEPWMSMLSDKKARRSHWL